MSTVQVDAINESTTNAGVTVDGVLIKDSAIASSYISGLSAGGITIIDEWLMTANTTEANPIINNLSRSTIAGFTQLGSGMTVSSGIWTFPETGHYFVGYSGYYQHQANSNVINMRMQATTDNGSSYSTIKINQNRGGSGSWGSESLFATLDVTDTSLVKVKFDFDVGGTTPAGTLYGSSTSGVTKFTFMKLADT
jgi:hypothetical protein